LIAANVAPAVAQAAVSQAVNRIAPPDDVTLVGIKYDPQNRTTDFASYLDRPNVLIVYNENFEQFINKADCTPGGGNGRFRENRSDSTGCATRRQATVLGIPTMSTGNQSVLTLDTIIPNTNGKTYRQVLQDSVNQIVSRLRANNTIKYVLWSTNSQGGLATSIADTSIPFVQSVITEANRLMLEAFPLARRRFYPPIPNIRNHGAFINLPEALRVQPAANGAKVLPPAANGAAQERRLADLMRQVQQEQQVFRPEDLNQRARLDRLIRERREQDVAQANKKLDKRDVFAGPIERDLRANADRAQLERERLKRQNEIDRLREEIRAKENLVRREQQNVIRREQPNRGGFLDGLFGNDRVDRVDRGNLMVQQREPIRPLGGPLGGFGGPIAGGPVGAPIGGLGAPTSNEGPGFLAKLKNMFGNNGGELVARGIRQPQAIRAAQLAVGQLERDSLAGLLASINKLAPILGPIKSEKLLRHTRESIIDELDKKCLANGLTLFDEVAGECIGVVDAFAEAAKTAPVPQPRFDLPPINRPVPVVAASSPIVKPPSFSMSSTPSVTTPIIRAAPIRPAAPMVQAPAAPAAPAAPVGPQAQGVPRLPPRAF
jgi:hypothetical protein